MSRMLSNALMSLLKEHTDSITEEVNALIANYTEEDLQEAVLLKDNHGLLPIHRACRNGAPLEVIQLLLRSDAVKKSIYEKDRDGQLPIHIACNGRAKSVEVIRLLLDSDVEKKLTLEKDVDGRLPIHCFCHESSTPEVIQLLLESDTDKKLILEKDNRGWLPIHYACIDGAPLEVIQSLLDSDADKKTILVRDVAGRLPIHYACYGRSSTVELVRLLLESDADKKSFFEKDNDGEVLILFACDRGDVPVEVVQFLVKASICDRIEQLDLQQCRFGIEELISDMRVISDMRADDDSIQNIYKRLSNYEEMERTISSLALVIWRTSCLKWGDIQFKSMQEMEDLGATDETFDPAEYKRERRIKSGADVIIRGVLPFLPVEDDTTTTTRPTNSTSIFSRCVVEHNL